MRTRGTTLLVLAAALAAAAAAVGTAFAHCDGLDGPVVKAAQRAIETGNLNYALI